MLVISCVFLSGLILQSGCISNTKKDVSEIEFWHSYEGEQKDIFEQLVSLYNSNEGASDGVRVLPKYIPVEEISKQLNSNIETFVGFEDYPEISFISSETANKAYSYNLLVCAENYLTKTQLSQYFSGFLSEGRFTGSDKTYIFPITKKVDVMIINGSEWNNFYRGRDVSLEDWNTWKGLEKLGNKYYSWAGGKALFAFESLENFIFTYTAQKLPVLVQAGNNEIKINTNKELFKGIWDIYYKGVVRGYISQTNDIKGALENREIIAYIGAPCGRNELPAQYLNKNETKSTMSVVSTAYPVVNDSRNIVPQTGNGVAVFNHGDKINTASYNFLHWLCTNDKAIELGFAENEIASCEKIYKTEVYENIINEKYLVDYTNTQMLSTSIEQLTDGSSYGSVEFIGYDKFSDSLEASLFNAAAKGRKEVLKLVGEGMSHISAIGQVDNEAAFEDWYSTVLEIISHY